MAGNRGSGCHALCRAEWENPMNLDTKCDPQKFQKKGLIFFWESNILSPNIFEHAAKELKKPQGTNPSGGATGDKITLETLFHYMLWQAYYNEKTSSLARIFFQRRLKMIDFHKYALFRSHFSNPHSTGALRSARGLSSHPKNLNRPICPNNACHLSDIDFYQFHFLSPRPNNHHRQRGCENEK